MKTDNSLIRRAKDRCPIPMVWSHLGLPGRAIPGKVICSPFRKDRHPSFSIFKDGKRFHDFGTGERGDAIDLIQKARGCDKREAFRTFLNFANEGSFTTSNPTKFVTESRRPLPECDLRLGSDSEIQGLSDLRNLPLEGLKLAEERGFLRFAEIRDHISWVLTDNSRKNIQARRLDGAPWEHLPSFPKAYTLPKSQASWPLGADKIAQYQKVALVEGGPDALAAHACIAIEEKPEVGVLAVLGAANGIPKEVLISLKGKPVRIFGHNDASGQRAAQNWKNQLHSVSCSVSTVVFSKAKQLNGKPVKDLCDLWNIGPDDFEAYDALREVLP